MFILSSISSGLEFWSVNYTSIYENSDVNFFKKIKLFGELSSNCLNNLLRINACKTLGSCWWSLLTILQWTNTTSVISKLDTFSPFLSLVILLLLPPSNFIVSGAKSLIYCLYFKCDFIFYFIYVCSYWRFISLFAMFFKIYSK